MDRQAASEENGRRAGRQHARRRSRIVKGTLHAIQRKFELFRRLEFLVPGESEDIVEDIFLRLSRKTSVVLEFGRYGNTLEAYVLVANFLTRRIHERYVAPDGPGRRQDGR